MYVCNQGYCYQTPYCGKIYDYKIRSQSKAGMSNSNYLAGRKSIKNCKKRPQGPHFTKLSVKNDFFNIYFENFPPMCVLRKVQI